MPKSLVGHIIGKNCQQIKSFKTCSGARISIKTMDSDKNNFRCRVSETEAQVTKAKKMAEGVIAVFRQVIYNILFVHSWFLLFNLLKQKYFF